MKWKIIKFIIIASRTIKIENIQKIRRFIFKKDIFPGGYMFGNVLNKKIVVLILKKRIFFSRKILITPPNPDEFIERINIKLISK
jgi:hypothetical protein